MLYAMQVVFQVHMLLLKYMHIVHIYTFCWFIIYTFSVFFYLSNLYVYNLMCLCTFCAFAYVYPLCPCLKKWSSLLLWFVCLLYLCSHNIISLLTSILHIFIYIHIYIIFIYRYRFISFYVCYLLYTYLQSM